MSALIIGDVLCTFYLSGYHQCCHGKIKLSNQVESNRIHLNTIFDNTSLHGNCAAGKNLYRWRCKYFPIPTFTNTNNITFLCNTITNKNYMQ